MKKSRLSYVTDYIISYTGQETSDFLINKSLRKSQITFRCTKKDHIGVTSGPLCDLSLYIIKFIWILPCVINRYISG